MSDNAELLAMTKEKRGT